MGTSVRSSGKGSGGDCVGGTMPLARQGYAAHTPRATRPALQTTQPDATGEGPRRRNQLVRPMFPQSPQPRTPAHHDSGAYQKYRSCLRQKYRPWASLAMLSAQASACTASSPRPVYQPGLPTRNPRNQSLAKLPANSRYPHVGSQREGP